MRTRHLQMTLAGVFAAGGLLVAGTSPAEADIRHVNQIVYGMDCAPCAFGTERRMNNIDAVTDVELSLNDGTVVLDLEPGNDVTLHHIRDQIVRGGFSPRAGTITVHGQLDIDADGNHLLVTATDEDFHLKRAEPAEDEEQIDQAHQEAWDELQQIEAGDRVIVQGLVPRTERRDEPVMLDLHVEAIELEPDDDEETA